MKNKLIPFLAIVLIPQVFIGIAILGKPKKSDPAIIESLKHQVISSRPKKAVDHGKLVELQKDFKSPQEVTEACLSCHTERGNELLTNHHWLWERESYIEGRGVVYLGKKNLINNFCTGIGGSEGTCNKCHAGYGWEDNSFDFTDQRNMDCLICHDNTQTYEKASGGAGYPPKTGPLAPNYRLITANVGKPTKYNCGYCHFYSAGGNNIKHGHLEEALLNTNRNVDVHMAKEGMNMSCTECHKTQNHVMLGRYYGTASNNYNRATCEQCHGSTPHVQSKLNEHTVKVACQTCHIPTYAKVNPTKMYWDWSTACDLKDGKPFELMDSTGKISYQSIKGTAYWERNVKPEYVWFNGEADHMLATDSITEFPVKINTLFGDYNDSNAKIWPVKIHRGKQPFDPNYHRVLKAKLWDREPGKGGLWVDFNWEASLREGMKIAGLPWSGEWEFVETEMYLPISHMVSPKDQVLGCNDCHTRSESRLATLTDFYMPGRDRVAAIDTLGILLILGTLGGVVAHGSFRILSASRRKKQAQV